MLELIYESALCIKLNGVRLNYERQKPLSVKYKNQNIGEFRVGFLVEDGIVVESKSVESSEPIFEAQLLSYMKLGDHKIGLLINFNSRLLKDGVKRLIL